MKKILFPTILIATLLAGGVVAFAIWRTSPATAEDYLQKAKKAYEEKDFATATIQLLNAVQQDGNNREANLLLAQSYVSQGDPGSAVKQLRRVLESNPNDREVTLQLGSLYTQYFGEEGFKEAEKVADKLLEINPRDVEALILKGNARAGLKDFTGSKELFEQVVGIDPQNSGAFVSLGTSQILQQNLPEAEQAYLKARELDPKSKGALISLANYYRAIRDTTKAENILKEAMGFYPTDALVYRPLAEMYYQVGRFDDAFKLLQDIQAKDSANPNAGFMLSEMYAIHGQPQDARRVLLDLKKQHPENLEVSARLARNMLTDDPARARAEIDQIISKQPGNPVALTLLGQAQFLSGDYEAAKATLNQAANSRLPDVPYFLGSIEAKKGQLDSALDYYKKALIINPNYLPARTSVASVLLDKGRASEARIEIDKALAVNKRYVPARVTEAAVDRAEKKYIESEKKLAALLKEQPSSPDLHVQMALTHTLMGRNADAEGDLLKARELQPDSFERLRELCLFYVQTKQVQKAIQALDAVPSDKRQAIHYELMGGVYGAAGKLPEAEAAYKTAIEKDAKGTNADASLASLYIRTGRLDEGLEKLEVLIQKNPVNAGAHSTKGMIYEAKGNVDQAKDSYERALQIDPNFDIAANNLAYILAERSLNLDKALTLAEGARKRNVNDPGVADTLGWVYYKMGNHTFARDQLLFATSKQPDNPVMQYHLGMIYKASNQTKEAVDALRKATASPRDYKEKALAQAALKEISK